MIKRMVPAQWRDDKALSHYERELLRGSTPGPAQAHPTDRADRSVAELRDESARARMRAYKGIGLSGAAHKH
jgi:hypothetical protein